MESMSDKNKLWLDNQFLKTGLEGKLVDGTAVQLGATIRFNLAQLCCKNNIQI